MHTKSSTQSGLFNIRAFFAVTLVLLGGSIGWLSFAANPTQGTITDASGPQTYTAGPFFEANQSPVGLGQLDTGPRCQTGFPCDTYTLHVQLPANYGATHCFPIIKV